MSFEKSIDDAWSNKGDSGQKFGFLLMWLYLLDKQERVPAEYNLEMVWLLWRIQKCVLLSL